MNLPFSMEMITPNVISFCYKHDPQIVGSACRKVNSRNECRWTLSIPGIVSFDASTLREGLKKISGILPMR